MNNNIPNIRQRKGTDCDRLTLTVSTETQEKLGELKKLFATRWPQERYPTTSLLFEQLLAKVAKELEQDPQWLEVELIEFRRRYSKPK